MVSRAWFACVWFACVLFACGRDAAPAIDAPVAIDTAIPVDVPGQVPDGTPVRQPCTSQFGGALSANPTFGRLDGYLVAVVPPSGMNACNADDAHVHLQIRMDGEIYDIAVDVTDASTHTDDVHTTTRDAAMPGNVPWSEGWHTGFSVDYPSLGVHAADLPLNSKAQLAAALEDELATVNHISVYATSYGPDGAHLVHRNGSSRDGIIATQPLSGVAHLRLLSFTDQSF